MYTSWVITTNSELWENKIQPQSSQPKTLLCSLSVRMVDFSLKVRGEFIKLGLFQCSIGQPVIWVSQALKIIWLLIHQWEKSRLLLPLERFMVKFPYTSLSLPLVLSSSDKESWQGLAVNKTRDMKTGRADKTRASAFWPWGHSITSTEWQEHRSKIWSQRNANEVCISND